MHAQAVCGPIAVHKLRRGVSPRFYLRSARRTVICPSPPVTFSTSDYFGGELGSSAYCQVPDENAQSGRLGRRRSYFLRQQAVEEAIEAPPTFACVFSDHCLRALKA